MSSPAVSARHLLLQLCNGGSVTELVKGLLRCGQQLDEALISYILYGALLVRMSIELGMAGWGWGWGSIPLAYQQGETSP